MKEERDAAAAAAVIPAAKFLNPSEYQWVTNAKGVTSAVPI